MTDFRVVDPHDPDAQAALRAYLEEMSQRIAAAHVSPDHVVDVDGYGAPDGAFVLGRDEHGIVACCAVQRFDATTCEIKRMWVRPDRRGQGVGSEVLAATEQAAESLGYTRAVLDTNVVNVEAIAMYAKRGYTPIERYNDNPDATHWFAKQLDA